MRLPAATAIRVLAPVLVGLASGARAADRVGSESCKSCHSAAYEVWRASGHARAAEALTPTAQADPRCAHCHSPEAGRWAQAATAFQDHDRFAHAAEPGVTCESCHGAGQFYSPSYVMRDPELARAVGLVDPGQKSCLVCHTPDAPSLVPFDFAAKVKLIDHWSGPGMAGTKAAAEAPAPGDRLSAANGTASGSPSSVPPRRFAESR